MRIFIRRSMAYPGEGVGDLQQGVFGFVDTNNMTLLDYNAADLRPKEKPSSPRTALWPIIRTRSSAGAREALRHGWSCDHLLYTIRTGTSAAGSGPSPPGSLEQVDLPSRALKMPLRPSFELQAGTFAF